MSTGLIAARAGGPRGGSIVTIGATQARGVGGLLAAAFHNERVTRWLVPDPARRPHAIGALFTGLVLDAFATGSVDVLTDESDRPVAAAVWFDHTTPATDGEPAAGPPAGSPLAPGEAQRWLLLDAAMTGRHPRPVHEYLMLVGVHPALQGHGLGARLLGHHHRRLDAAGTPAYLEATSPASRALYQRLGYTDHGPVIRPAAGAAAPDDARNDGRGDGRDGGEPVLWPMWRRPRGIDVRIPGVVASVRADGARHETRRDT